MRTPRRLIGFGLALGLAALTAPAALSGLRPWDETVAAVEAGWERNPLQVSGEGWFESQGGLWLGPHDVGD